MKKLIVTGVIILLIGVAFTPSINASIKEDGLVDLDVELLGIGKKHKITLTNQQINEIESHINEFKLALSIIETKAEAELLFKEIIFKLDKYGLFGNTNINTLQKLATIDYDFLKQKLPQQSYNKLNSENDNSNCLVAGQTTNTFFMGLPGVYIIFFIYLLVMTFSFLGMSIAILYSLLFIIKNKIFPFSFMNVVGLGYLSEFNLEFIPSTGWIKSIGLNGTKDWNGTFYGNFNFSNIEIVLFLFWFMFIYSPGIFGFTGIKVSYLGKHFFIGTALNVQLEYCEPE